MNRAGLVFFSKGEAVSLCSCVFVECFSWCFLSVVCNPRLAYGVLSGSMLYVLWSDCTVILYCALLRFVVLFIQYSVLLCIDCILDFCDVEIAICGMDVYSSMGLTIVL